MRAYLYTLRAVVGFFIALVFAIIWAFSSPNATKWMVQILNKNNQFYIESIEGNLQDGLKITNLKHPNFTLGYGELSLNWLALLHGKVHLSSLLLDGLSMDESLFKNSEKPSNFSGIQTPFNKYQIDTLHVKIQGLKYKTHFLSNLKITAKNLYYTPHQSPKGELFIDGQSSLGDLNINAHLDKKIEANGNFTPKELPYGIKLYNPIVFKASGDTKKVQFDLQTTNLTHKDFNLSLDFKEPKISGNYIFYEHSLEAKFESLLDFAKSKIELNGNFTMVENDPKTLSFNLESKTKINQNTLQELSEKFELPVLKTILLDKDVILTLQGSQNKINYTLQVPHIATKDAKISNWLANGSITSNSLDGDFLGTLKALNIPTKFEGNFNLNNFNINTLAYTIKADSNLKELINSSLKSKISGNLEGIKFTSTLAPLIHNGVEIKELLIDGNATKASVDFNLQSAFGYKNNSLHVRASNGSLNLVNSPIILQINPQIKFNNHSLDFLQNPQLTLSHSPQTTNILLNSKYLYLNSTYKAKGAFFGSLHVKPIDSSFFIDFPKAILPPKLGVKGDFKYDKSIHAKGNLFLDDLKLAIKAKGDEEKLDLNLSHSNFKANIKHQNQTPSLSLKIEDLNDFIKTIQPYFAQKIPLAKGALALQISQENNTTNFHASSNELSYEEQKIDNLALRGRSKNGLITLNQLDFELDSSLGVESTSSFSLTNPAIYDTKTTDLRLDFKGLSIRSIFEPKLSININTDNFFLSHPHYGEGVFSGALHVSQADTNITIGGEMRATKVKSHYKPPGFSIHSDKDIIIVEHNESKKEDFFTQNIGLDLALLIDDLHYKQGGNNLKTSGVFYLKKEPLKLLEFYGSVLDITGEVITLGKKFDISASNLYFRGYNPIDPVLDIVALYKHKETDITIKITGTQSNPRVYLSSNPLMPQRDIFSILIFGTRLGDNQNPHSHQNRTTQASVFLVNELSKDYIKALGLDILMFEYDPNSGTIETTIGKEITDKTTLMLKNESEGGVAIIEQKLSPKWKIELGIGGESQSIDIVHKKKY